MYKIIDSVEELYQEIEIDKNKFINWDSGAFTFLVTEDLTDTILFP